MASLLSEEPMQSMSWLEFIVAMTYALAWPAVVAGALFFLREPLGRLFKPEDVSAQSADWRKKLEKSLQEGQKQAELLNAGAAPIATDAELRKRLQFEDDLPEAIVLLAYNELLNSLLRAKPLLHLDEKTPPRDILRELIVARLVPEPSLLLFMSLTEARDAAVHAADEESISRAEAINFRTQAQKVKSLVDEGVARGGTLDT
jgi:hypothetical protein